jgi:hypothetical protein
MRRHGPHSPMRVAPLLSLILFLLWGCGGGSSGGGGNPPPPAADFSLSVPANASTQQGSSTTITIGMTALNGFNSQVSVTVSGMPAGVTATPSQFTLSAGGQQSVVIAASLTAGAATSTVAVTGTSGTLQHSGQIGLKVSALEGPPPAVARIRYVRTDTQWDISFFNFFPQTLILYHPGTHRFFVSDTSLNQVVVMDAQSEVKIGEITVPGAFVGDISPDQSTIYIGTQVGDLYEIDPVAMAVKARIPAVEIGPSGFPAFEVRTLADGRLALLSGEGGIPAVDGFSAVGIWNPATNAFSIAGSAGVQSGCPLTDHIVAFNVTADRSRILLGSGVSGGALCSYDPATGKQVVVDTNPTGVGIGQILVPPDGREILVAGGSDVIVYDATSLLQIDQFFLGTGSNSYRFLLSSDGNTLFGMNQNTGFGVAYNWRTHSQTGWIPSFNLYDTPGAMAPLPMAVDQTGLLACAIGHGVALLDGGALESQPPGTDFGFGYNNVVQPSFGPVPGGTQVVLTSFQGTNVENVSFGPNTAPIGSTGSSGITVTTPPGVPGPVDVSVSLTDRGFWLFPQDYSYGPSIVEIRPEATTAEGGGTGTIYGYGFGPPTPGAQAAGLQVSVGGQPATITQYLPQPYSQSTPYYPFPLEAFEYTLPTGTAGSTEDVTVSNGAGSTTVSKGMHYLPAVQHYSLTGAALVQGIYDPTRDVYYFTDQAQIRVFSKSKAQWLSPIAMPAAAQRLWALSLSPSGTKLAVSDAGSGQIFTLNPDAPVTVSSFVLPTAAPDQGEEPCGLGITDSGIVYYASFSSGFTGGWAIHKLDTSTGTVTDFHALQEGAATSDAFTRMLVTSDSARVIGNMNGLTFTIDTATDTFVFNPTLQQGSDYELTLSSNQTWMSAAEFLMDTNLNPQSYVVYTDRDIWNQSAVYGEKLSPDGNLLFAPLSNGIDVIDGKQGTLRMRIALPFPLSANYDALVGDGRDNVLIAITGQTGDGIAVIDLTSLPEGVASLAATTQRSDPLRMAQWTANSTFAKPRSTSLIKRGTPPKLIRPQHNSVSPALSFGPGAARTRFAKLL